MELRPRRPHQESTHFQVSFCKFCSSGSTWWPLPACPSFKNMHYRFDFIDIFDALINSMLDHRTDTKNQKTSAMLHGNAPEKMGRAPRCMGTLFAFSWSSWVPPRVPQAIAQIIYFQVSFAIFVLRDLLVGRSRRALKLKICNIALVL